MIWHLYFVTSGEATRVILMSLAVADTAALVCNIFITLIPHSRAYFLQVRHRVLSSYHFTFWDGEFNEAPYDIQTWKWLRMYVLKLLSTLAHDKGPQRIFLKTEAGPNLNVSFKIDQDLKIQILNLEGLKKAYFAYIQDHVLWLMIENFDDSDKNLLCWELLP